MKTTQTAKDIWVYGDLRTERFFRYSLNVLSAASGLSRSTGGQAAVVLMPASEHRGPAGAGEADAGVPLEAARKAGLCHGAERIYILENKHLSQIRADIHAAVLAKAVKALHPMLVLFPLTEFSRELAARAARICNAGLIADCLAIRMTADGILATCPSWGGEILADIAFSKPTQTGFATVQPQAYAAVESTGQSGSTERVPIGPIRIPSGIDRVSRIVDSPEHRKLEEAQIVVVGGAGLGTGDGFGMVRQLAASLGGEVGATRPPVIQHWADEDQLIGQTGRKVRPNLLITVGTSGAVQYTAGIMEAKTIVAVNRDPSSPIFHLADIGVIADAKGFLPVFIAKVRQRLMRKLADALAENEHAKDTGGFGARILQLRKSHGLSLEALAQATGKSPDFIEQVEANRISPSVSFLLSLASALNVDPGTFLREEEKTKIRDMRTQAYVKRTQSYNYQTLTDGAEKNHLQAFMITIESRQTHKPIAYKHEGEEFIYVMEGHVELTLGGKVRDLKPGEYVHFHSDTPHKLKNLSNETTRLLVALYTI